MHPTDAMHCEGRAILTRNSVSTSVHAAHPASACVRRAAAILRAAIVAFLIAGMPAVASTVVEPGAPVGAAADPATATALALQWSEVQFAFATCEPDRLERLAAGAGADVASLAHHLALRAAQQLQSSTRLMQAITAASIGRTAFEDAQQASELPGPDAAERLLLRDCLRNQPTWKAMFDGLAIQASAVHGEIAASALTWNGRPIAIRLQWQRGESGWLPALDGLLAAVWFAEAGSAAQNDPAWFDLAAAHDRAWRAAVSESDRPARVAFELRFPIERSFGDERKEMAQIMDGLSAAPAYRRPPSRTIDAAYGQSSAAGSALDDLLAARGDADAALQVALRLYADSDGTREADASRLLSASAEGGHPAAMDLLAGMYVSGEGGFPVDCSAAAKWSLRAHELGYPDSGNNLAWVLATSPDRQCRNGELAVELAEQSVAQARAVPLHESVIGARLDTLAAAYCEAGRIADAVTAQIDAVALEPIVETEQRLQRYRAGSCWYGASGGGAGTASISEPNPEQDSP